MSNPFRDAAVAGAESPAETPEPSVFETAPEVDEVEAEEAADESYGKFEDPEAPKSKPTEQPTVPTKRLAQVVRQRNELRETVAQQEARLAAAEARAETLAELSRVVDTHYAENPGLLDFDARFMATFDTMAKTNPTLAQAAALVKAAMSGEVAPVTTTPETPEVAEEAPAADPVLSKIVARDVTRTVTEVLGTHDVKPHFVKAIAADMLATLDATELADLTPEDVVEIAKAYRDQNEIPMSEFLAPKKGAARPATTSGRGAPARSSAPEAAQAEERTKPKSVEEWQENRDKRFKALTRDLGF